MRHGGVAVNSLFHFAFLKGFASFALLTACAAHAAPGDIDTSFGTGGRMRINANLYTYNAYNGPLLIEANGSVVLAGVCETAPAGTSTSSLAACLARVLVDGAVDPTFGSNGLAIGNADMSDKLLAGLARQSDGKYALGGTCGDLTGYSFCALRFTSAGAPDSTFGVAGVANLARPAGASEALAFAIAINRDGTLTLMGRCKFGSEDRLCVLRLLTNGQPDSSYGINGYATVSLQPTVQGFYNGFRANRLPNGKMQFSSLCDLAAGLHYCVAQLTADGLLDATFNSAGALPGLALRQLTADYNVELNAMTSRGDGSVILAAKCKRFRPSPGPDELCLQSFTASGQIDTNFGNAGERRITPDINTGSQIPNSVMAMADGRLVVAAGCSTTPTLGSSTCVNRHLADGSLDPSFKPTQLFVDPRPGYNSNALGVQASGKIIIGGACRETPFDPTFVPSFCITRIQGGPFDYAQCSADVDGDGLGGSATDSLILARVSLGFTGNAVTQGITFASTAQRTSWPAIRDYLFNQCGMAVSP
jgi:uncharacterized delta-60 repeat protein